MGNVPTVVAAEQPYEIDAMAAAASARRGRDIVRIVAIIATRARDVVSVG